MWLHPTPSHWGLWWAAILVKTHVGLRWGFQYRTLPPHTAAPPSYNTHTVYNKGFAGGQVSFVFKIMARLGPVTA